MKITAERARELLNYEPETGVFTWKERPVSDFVSGVHGPAQECKRWNSRYAGIEAGRYDAKGYRVISIGHKPFLAHRLAWLIVSGEWPAEHIDHRNGDPADNRITNLRECSHAENHQNRRRQSNNTSGFIGVTRRKTENKWAAKIRVGGKEIHLGVFREKEAAAAAYADAKRKFHTFHPNKPYEAA